MFHITPMSDEHDIAAELREPAASQYRVHVPGGQKPTLKSGEKGAETAASEAASEDASPQDAPKEFGGPKGPEPTRFGDWERGGRCVDF